MPTSDSDSASTTASVNAALDADAALLAAALLKTSSLPRHWSVLKDITIIIFWLSGLVIVSSLAVGMFRWAFNL